MLGFFTWVWGFLIALKFKRTGVPPAVVKLRDVLAL